MSRPTPPVSRGFLLAQIPHLTARVNGLAIPHLERMSRRQLLSIYEAIASLLWVAERAREFAHGPGHSMRYDARKLGRDVERMLVAS